MHGCHGESGRVLLLSEPLAFNNIDRQPTLACLLVLTRHVEPGLAHGFDHLIELYLMRVGGI
ncbi:hypothetical protein GCM10022278_01330 [Allohahella marinimesophila]|uniref:Uncharacterized protein n=1 Tax=Allohahella marinimesophila TaxID=1054972 RepID=A0ABP7NG60_9GAMM